MRPIMEKERRSESDSEGSERRKIKTKKQRIRREKKRTMKVATREKSKM
jgi:hypothetical protein